MKFSHVEDRREFWNELYSTNALESAIYWITDRFGPEDIYDKEILERWAVDNDFERKE